MEEVEDKKKKAAEKEMKNGDVMVDEDVGVEERERKREKKEKIGDLWHVMRVPPLASYFTSAA